jgi:glucose/arabinose dehydrogenase
MKIHRATPPTRRRLAGLLGIVVLMLALAPAGASGASTVVLTPVAAGLSAPVYVTSANDGTGRLFVVEQTGRIRVIKNGVLLPTPFLDISDRISNGTEQGLLGLAFHPNFKTNGRFYVNFTRTNGNTSITEFRRSPSNPDVGVKSSARGIIEIAQPYANHNGGMITFGAGGYLYIGMGDGGSSGDPANRAQNLGVLLGKMLRIDVNGSVGTRHYRIPASNPYVGKIGRDEIWSRGLRNPWRFSFDRLTGDLWVGDVGQDRYEEIDRAKVTTTSSSRGRGANFGWRQLEGSHCYNPATGCSRTGKVMPVVEYTHADGCSVTGGYVYRGAAVPSLYGKYVFGDYCSGKIWTFPAGAPWQVGRTLLMDTNLAISSFGEDQHGELYVVDRGGTVYRFTGS